MPTGASALILVCTLSRCLRGGRGGRGAPRCTAPASAALPGPLTCSAGTALDPTHRGPAPFPLQHPHALLVHLPGSSRRPSAPGAEAAGHWGRAPGRVSWGQQACPVKRGLRPSRPAASPRGEPVGLTPLRTQRGVGAPAPDFTLLTPGTRRAKGHHGLYAGLRSAEAEDTSPALFSLTCFLAGPQFPRLYLPHPTPPPSVSPRTRGQVAGGETPEPPERGCFISGDGPEAHPQTQGASCRCSSCPSPHSLLQAQARPGPGDRQPAPVGRPAPS